MPDAVDAVADRTAQDDAVIGHFNLNSDWRLEGWCCRPGRPLDRPLVDVTLNGRVVYSCLATQLNDTLRQSGIGDGRYGFSLAPPAQIGTAANGEAIVEACERRTGTVLGRVIFHAERGIADRAQILDRFSAQTQELFAAVIDRQDARLHVIGAAFHHLGHDLLMRQHMRTIGRTEDAASKLRQISSKLSRYPTVKLSYSASPELSLIFLGGDNWQTTVDAMRHAVTALCSLQLEIILLTDGSDPGHLLMHRCVTNLRIMRHQGPGTFVRAVNDAAFAARGLALCIVENARHFNVQGLEDVVRHGALAVFGGSAGQTLNDSPQSHLLRAWTRPRLQDGVAVVAPRKAIMAVGGFDAENAGTEIAWCELAAKLAALSIPIEGWNISKVPAGLRPPGKPVNISR